MPQQIMDDFSSEFLKSSGVMTFTQVGIKMFADSVGWVPPEVNSDPRMILSRSAPTDPGARADASWSKSEIEGAADPEGWLQEWITQAWIALIFSRWEDHYRPLFAKAERVDKNQVTSDVMGDIRNLRNDVIHHNGTAGKNTAKNKFLIRFGEGDRIVLAPEDIWLLSDNLQVAIDVSETP